MIIVMIVVVNTGIDIQTKKTIEMTIETIIIIGIKVQVMNNTVVLEKRIQKLQKRSKSKIIVDER